MSSNKFLVFGDTIKKTGKQQVGSKYLQSNYLAKVFNQNIQRTFTTQ